MTRIDRLRKKLPEDFEAALVQNDSNRAYLANFSSSAGTIVITPKHAWLLVDFRYFEMAKARAEGVEVLLVSDSQRTIGELLDGESVTRVMIESETSLGTLASLKKSLKGRKFQCDSVLSNAIAELRMIKDEGEIELIKAAQAITDAAFSHILGYIKIGVSERDVAAELEYFMRKNGADGMAFGTICVSGKKTSLPHGKPDETKIVRGALLTMDFGARKGGYCSDMTRTVAVGEAGEEERKIYNIVLRAHLESMAAAREGVLGCELDKIARDIIYGEGYEGCFGHGLGHSLGLDIHEPPRANTSGNTALKSGMMMTIEPGIYLEGRFGVRIENMIVIRKDGFENLTASPRELITL
ncbi:MAG: aminopeptidase P family protein [Oscillospiraceae bacterium]